MICPDLLKVPSAFFTSYGVANLCVTRLLVSTNFWSMKFVVAPESTRASVCTFFPYTQSVTGSLKDDFLLRAIFILQDSSTTFSKSCLELIVGILFPHRRSQTLSSTVHRENPR